ncbi:MAG: response regulator [Vicinamibacterales bacterium]
MTRVIIVDDQEENRYFLRALLEGHGYEVETAHHGAEALALARQNPPDLAVSDLLMPVMDGYTLLRHWKADERLSRAPFIVYTATYTEPRDEQLALDLGADAFIVKPAEPEAFIARLQDALRQVGSSPARTMLGMPTPDVVKEYNEVLLRKLEEKAIQLEQANASMNDTTALLKRAQHLANVGSWAWHIDRNQVEWSDQMYEIFGVPPGTPSGDLAEVVARAIHPDDRAVVQASNVAVVEFRSPGPIEYRVVRPDGTVRSVWAETDELVRDEEGRPVLLTGIVLDITEEKRVEAELRRSVAELDQSRRALLSLVEDQKRAEAEVRRLNAELEERVRDRTAQLEEANRELDAFAYSVSHDLRAPLRAVDGFARILVEDYGTKLDAEGQRLCAVVSDSARDMGRLIDSLLSLSRIGRAALRPARVDMGRLVAQVFDNLATPADRARLDFRVADLPEAEADPVLIRLVWQNLLSNAIKFTAKREHAIIEVRASIEGPDVVYSVRDNGAGFDMQYADKLFGVFQRLHSVQEFEGTGVGLPIVQRIVHRHGGRVWAEGRTNEGAVFFFTCAPAAGA